MGSIAVLVKQIPEHTIEPRLDNNFRFVREGKIVIDYADLFGVEVALQLKESIGASEVVVFSMAPGGELSGVRTALAMGADRAVVISDDALVNAHSLATAKVLNSAINHAGDFELVIGGVESSDGYTGTLPAQIAALRNVSALTFATSIHAEGDTLNIKRQSNEGIDEVSAKLPAIVSVTAGVVEPRYPNFKGIMAAKSKPCEVLALADINVDVDSLDIESQKVTSVVDAPTRESGVLISDQEQGADKIIEFLQAQGVLS